MRRPARLGLWALAGSLLLALYLGLPWLAERWLARRPPPSSAPPPAQGTRVDALLAAELANTTLVEEEPEPRQDAAGTWSLQVLRARLPPGETPTDRAAALSAALTAESPQIQVYTTSEGPWAVLLRIYDGKRPTHRLRLESSEVEAPAAATAPWLALVFTGLGPSASAAQALIAAPVPLTLAVRPYTPYALRICQDALRAQKEVLLELPADEDPEAALRALLYPTGLVLLEPRAQLPAALLAQEGLYLAVDPGALGSTALREARRQHVRTLALPALEGQSPEERARRALALSRSQSATALRVPAGLPGVDEALLTLLQSGQVRPVFATEALDRLSAPR